MKAEIITIGDEILIGQIVDTNSAWMAQRLGEIGLSVGRKYSVGDTAAEIKSAVEESMQRADVVLITGGLGPTKDDITKHTLSELFDSPLVRHQPTFERVARMMTLRGIEFNELNQAQALVPECCTVLDNLKGTAPAMWFEHQGKVVVSLPGVPFEMEALMLTEVLPRLKDHFALRSVVHRTAITFGLAESMMAELIEPWESALPDHLHLAYLPSPTQLRLRLSAYDVDQQQAQAEMEEQMAALRELIADYFVGYEEDTVASVVADMLRHRHQSVAAAESCTGGQVSSAFTAMAGASDYFMGGVVAYDNSIKTSLLGVQQSSLDEHGAVSQQVAIEMAEGVRRLCNTTYGIATTGIAGPTGGSEQKPVGTVWIAVAGPDGTVAEMKNHGKLRAQNIQRAAVAAINLLRRELLKA